MRSSRPEPKSTEFELTEKQTRDFVRWLALKAERARKDPSEFYEFVMREETSRRRVKILPHQRVMIEFIMAHPKSVIRAPVGFGKTYVIAALTMWLLGDDPTQRGVALGAAQQQSRKILDIVRRYIESSHELALAFPELRQSARRGDVWSQTAITVDRPFGIRDPSLRAMGIGGKLPGSRLSWILCDDLLTAENTASEQGRQYTRHWVGTTVLDRLDAVDSRIAVCNVPWVPKSSVDRVGDITYELEAPPYSWPSLTLDAYGDVEIRNTDWDSPLIRPAHGDNPDGVRHRLTAHDSPEFAKYVGKIPGPGWWQDVDDEVPLWPERYPLAKLEEKRALMAGEPGNFNRSFRCKPRDEATAHVKVEWVERAKARAVELGEHRHLESFPGGLPVVTGVDPAFGQKKTHDKSSIFTFAVLPNRMRRVLDVEVGRWPGGELADKIISASRRYNSIVCVEGNAAQRWMKDIIKAKNASMLVRTLETGKNKNDPRFGVQSIFMEIEDGLWLFPNDGELDAKGAGVPGKCPPGVQAAISALFEYDPTRHTPDELMSWWIAREYARKLGLLHGPGPGAGGPLAGRLAALGAR